MQSHRICNLTYIALGIKSVTTKFLNKTDINHCARSCHILAINMDKFVTKTTRAKTKTESTDSKPSQKSPPSPSSTPSNRSVHVTRTAYKASVTEDKEKFLKMTLDEKRKLYKCGKKYVTLADVPTWPEYYEFKAAKLQKAVSKKRLMKKYEVNEEINSRVSIWRGDITTLEIDAITNAANSSLLGGGGVDGAIHSAAGKMLVAECVTLNGCDSGKAKITGGYKLPAKYVIHTVGPIGEKALVLEDCYKNVLSLVEENNLHTVAIPCISTGIYGYPNEGAVKVALDYVRNFLERKDMLDKIERVIFCLFMPVDVQLYEEYMQVYFPIPITDSTLDNSKNKDTVKQTEKQEKMDTTNDSKKDDSVKSKTKTESKAESMDMSGDKKAEKEKEKDGQSDSAMDTSNKKTVAENKKSETKSETEAMQTETTESQKVKSEPQEEMQTETPTSEKNKSEVNSKESKTPVSGPVTRKSLQQKEESEPLPKKAMATTKL